MIDAQPVDDGVVLTREQRLHGGKTNPPVAVDAGKLLVCTGIGRGIRRQVASIGQANIAGRAPYRVLRLLVGAVDLGAVPPMGDGVAVGRRPALVGGAAFVVGTSAQHRQLRPGPVVAWRQRYTHRRRALVVFAVAQPIVHHELQPCRQQHVHAGRGNELAARQKLTADQARIGLVEARGRFAERFGDGRIAAETCVRPAHPNMRQVVEAAVGGAHMTEIEVRRGRRIFGRRLGVEQVEPAQVDAQRHQVCHGERDGQLKPDTRTIDQAKGRREHLFE